MKIKSLIMTNWKCYKFKTINFDENMNFYNQRNGFGKSSIFEAIIFAMYGVMPANTNQLKNDKEKPIVIELELVDEGTNSTVNIKREVVSPQIKKLYLRRQFETEYTSVSAKQMDEYIASIAGAKDLFPLIWSKEPIYTSSVLSIEYIKDKVFAKDFENADAIIKRVKEDRGYNVKREKTLEGIIQNKFDSISDEIEASKNKIKDIEESLKESPYKKTGLLDKAIKCLEAKDTLKGEEYENFSPLSTEEISRIEYLQNRKSKNEQTVKSFVPKNEDLELLLSLFNKSNTKQILKHNFEDDECPICKGRFSIREEFGMEYDEVINMLDSRVTMFDYEEAKRELEELENGPSEDIISKSKQYYSLLSIADLMDNPEEIIEQDKHANDELWNQYNEEKENLSKLEKILEATNEYIKVKDIKKKDTDIITAIETWKKEKTNNMILYVLSRTIEIMSKIDQKYISVYYSLEEECFQVAICVNDEINVLSHTLLSAGERSVLALALTLSYRSLVLQKKHLPNFFMLDESLSALDKDHLDRAISILKEENIQTLLINHS